MANFGAEKAQQQHNTPTQKIKKPLLQNPVPHLSCYLPTFNQVSSRAPSKSSKSSLQKRYGQYSGATFNIKDPLTDSKILDLAIYAKKFHEDFLFLQETHIPKSFDKTINNPKFKNWRIVGSGFGGNCKRGGVAILLSPRCKLVESVQYVDKSRIISVRVQIDGQFLQLTCCYTPDMSYADSTREAFWRKLGKFLDGSPKKYAKISGGDFNSCIVPTTVSRYGFGPFHPESCYEKATETNMNGNELLSLAAEQNMFLENSYYKNRFSCHSWTHQNIGNFKRRYDFFLVDKLTHTYSTNCRAYTAPFKSDHRLVSLKFKLPRKWLRKAITKSKTPKPNPRPDIKLLITDPDTRAAYQFMLEELTSNSNTPENMGDLDSLINKIILEATSKTVPKLEKQHAAHWMNDEYIKLREEAYSSKNSRSKHIKKLHKLQKKLINEYYKNMADDINEAADARDAEKLFRISKGVIGAVKETVTKSNCTEQQHVQYISEVAFKDRNLPIPDELNPDHPNFFIPECVRTAKDIDDSMPTFDEVVSIIKTNFKLRKAPGCDGVFNENLKVAVECEQFMKLIYELVQKVWNDETIPIKWKHCVISLLYKKGSNDDPKNFRPLSLIHCISKIITKLLRKRMLDRYHEVLSDEQFGFRTGTGTIDAIFCFRQLIKSKNGPIFALFLDLRGAFDRLPRNLLIKVLRIMLGNDKVARLLEDIHTDTTANVKHGSIDFDLKSGVRQGSDEGPNCFNLYFDYVLRVCAKEIAKKLPNAGIQFDFNILSESDTNTRANNRSTGPKNGKHTLLKMLYADDLVWYAKSEAELQQIIDIINPIFEKFGLIIAEDKTKSMVFKAPEDMETPEIMLGDSLLAHVVKFCYLGYNTSSENTNLFLETQVSAAWAAFGNNKRVLQCRKVNLKTRCHLLESLVKPVLLYAVQAWDLPKCKKQKLDALYRSFMRKMVNKGWKKTRIDDEGNHRPIIENKDLYRITGTSSIEKFIEKQFLKFQAHLTRLPNKNLQKQLQFIVRDPNPSNSENIWSRCSKLMGGMDETTMRKKMADRKTWYRALDLRFGQRQSKRATHGGTSQQAPELSS